MPRARRRDETVLFLRRLHHPRELIRWCESRLAYFQIPRYVELVDDFPRTPTERIRKDQLSASVTECFDREQARRIDADRPPA